MKKTNSDTETKHRPAAASRAAGERAQEALRQIVDGITSQVGEQFFRALVRQLAAALKVRFAFISQQLDDEGARLRLLAFWEGDDYGENFEYPTKGTPCELVVGKGLASFPSGLRELFPEDAWLREVGAESYLAIPLFDSTKGPLGHLGVMHDKPMDDEHLNEQILRIFAERAGGEMERKRVEETLRESEEKLHRLGNIVEFWLLDPTNYDVLYVSPACEKLWGRSRESLNEDASSWLAAVHPADLERVSAALKEHPDTGEFDAEFRIIRPDGSTRWVWDRAIPVKDERGHVQHLVGVSADITERKRAEETLETQARVLESMAEGVNVCDEGANIMITNRAFDAMFGYERGELVGQHVSVLNAESPEENARIVEDVQTQLKQVGSWRGEFNNVRKDGTLFTTSAHISALEVSGKTCLISVQEDVTEHKRAEDALRENEAKLRAVLEAIPDMMFRVSRDGVVRDFMATKGIQPALSPAEFLGKRLDEALPAWFAQKALQRVKAALQTGETQTFEYQRLVPLPNGDRPDYEVRIVVSAEDEVVALVRDITDRKRAEEALRESEARYRDLYDDAPVAYFAVRTDGRIVRANRRASELLGYGIDSLIGRSVLDLYADAPAGKAKAKLVVERVQRGQETRDEEMEMRRADGTPVWVSLTVRVVRDAQGQPLETRSMVLDITDRKQAEEALRMAREDLSSRVDRRGQRADANAFSIRELTVLNLVASGRSDKEIGTALGLSPRTVQKHVEKLCKKMGASNRTEASVQALRQGLID